MTPIEWIAAGQLAVGAGQLAVGAVGVILVWRGLQQMRHAGDQREKREDARHREAMQALANQAEGMRALTEGMRGLTEGMRVLTRGRGGPGRGGNPGMKKNGFSVIGKPLPRIDGPAKCAGDTRYADDMVMPRMLFCRLLRSPHPHALVHGVSARRALELPGVHAVITGEDVPTKFGIMPSTMDEEALAVDKVRYVGDPVAAVAAVSEDVAEEALRLIDVDYQVLDPILSIEGALEAGDHRIHTWNRRANIQKAVSFEFGEVDAGFEERTRSSRAPTSSRATPTCPWNSTARWRPIPRTAS